MSSWIFFIILILFIVVRAKAKSDADKKQRQAQDLKRRNGQEEERSYREPQQQMMPPIARENEEGAGNDVRDLFREIFKEFDPDPAPRSPYSFESKSAKTDDPYGLGESSEGYYAQPVGEGTAYDVFAREGPDLPMGEGSGLGRNYGMSMSSNYDPEGREFEGGRALIDYQSRPTEAVTAAPIRQKNQEKRPCQSIWQGKLSRNELIRGIVLAEVLGPPRAKKHQIR